MTYIFTFLTFLYLLAMRVTSTSNTLLNWEEAAALYILVLAQIGIQLYFSYKKQKQLPLPGLIKEKVIPHYIHVIIFPSVLFALTSLALTKLALQPLSLVIVFISTVFYSIIYENINGSKGIINEDFVHSYYHLTAYDSATIYIYILGIFDFITIFFSNDGLGGLISVVVVSIVLLTLFLIRYRQLNIYGIIFSSLGIISLAVVYYLTSVLLNFPVLESLFVQMLVFYFLMILLHHKIEGNIQKSLLIEYLMFVIIGLTVILFVFKT